MPADSLFDQALKAEGVSGKLADLARSIYTQESSGGKNTKSSNRGAVGGMQILPSTFRGVADEGWKIDDPMDNARSGIRYLKQLSKQAGGDPVLVAAGYYGGSGGLEKARQGIAVSDPKNPGAPNTLQYAAQAAARAGLAKGATSSTANVSGVISPAIELAAPAAVVAQSPEAAQLMTVAVAAPASAPVQTTEKGEATPDPWQEFLRTVAPTQRTITPEDFNYQFQQQPLEQASVQMAVAPLRTVRPNFDAFVGWKGTA